MRCSLICRARAVLSRKTRGGRVSSFSRHPLRETLSWTLTSTCQNRTDIPLKCLNLLSIRNVARRSPCDYSFLYSITCATKSQSFSLLSADTLVEHLVEIPLAAVSQSGYATPTTISVEDVQSLAAVNRLKSYLSLRPRWVTNQSARIYVTSEIPSQSAIFTYTGA